MEDSKLEELENFEAVRYRMDDKGIEYCFKNYSSFDEIRDEEFHKKRLALLNAMSDIRNYVDKKIEQLQDEI